MFALIKFIWNHPLNQSNRIAALGRFLKWQIGSWVLKKPVIHKFTEKSVLVVEKGMTGATQNIYCGLHDYWEMLFLLHFLRPEDQFLDVGSNVGAYSVLAGAHCESYVKAVEALPKTFEKLKRNVSINEISKIELYNLALGSKKGTINFTTEHDTTNHITTDFGAGTTTVPMTTLDDLVFAADKYKLLKIDVEGYEIEVLAGAERLLADEKLIGILIEINGSGERFGYSDDHIHNQLLEKGFSPYIYEPVRRRLLLQDSYGTHNTLYLNNKDLVEKRVSTAQKIKVFDQLY
jgi:FkbM family methyltransferase